MNRWTELGSDMDEFYRVQTMLGSRIMEVEAKFEARARELAQQDNETRNTISGAYSELQGRFQPILDKIEDLGGKIADFSALDPEQAITRVNQLRTELVAEIARAEGRTIRKVEEGIQFMEASQEVRFTNLINETRAFRGELATVRQEANDLKETVQELLRDWARFRRVMEAYRAGG